jgi:hypothetical protein
VNRHRSPSAENRRVRTRITAPFVSAAVALGSMAMVTPAAHATPTGPLAVAASPSPIMLLSPAGGPGPNTPAAAFNVGISGAAASGKITYLDTINGTNLSASTGKCTDSLVVSPASQYTADTNGHLELNVTLAGTCAPGKYDIIVINGAGVAITEYEITAANG